MKLKIKRNLGKNMKSGRNQCCTQFINLKKNSKTRKKREKNRMTEKKLKKYNEIWVKIKEKINSKVKKPEIW